MTVAEAWQLGREHLTAHGIDEAAITAEVLLRHALNCSRTDLYRAWDRAVDGEAWSRYQDYLAERVRRRPVAYIAGHREFMGLDFLVDERVLIPRPETEVLVEFLLEVLRGIPSPVIADIGTGSGAIAVSLAHVRPDAALIATDISPAALEVARANAARHEVADRIRFRTGDLLDPVTAEVAAMGRRFDAVACNPPYVDREAAAALPPEIREFEPRVAVVAEDGAEVFHLRLARAALGVLRPGGWLVMEVSAGQAPRVVELLHRVAYEAVQTRKDGLGWERAVAARLRVADLEETV